MQMLTADQSFVRRVVLGTFSASLVVGLLVALWASGQVVLLLILSLLMALLLRELSRRLRGVLPVSPRFSVLLVTLALVFSFGLAGFLLAPEIGKQSERLVEHLPLAYRTLEHRIAQDAWGRRLLQGMQGDRAGQAIEAVMQRATGIFNSVLGAGSSLLFVLFMALYVALDPHRYQDGFLVLFPPPRRARIREILDATAEALWQFLVAQGASMVLVFALTTLGLWAMGMPLFLALGLIAGLLTFIPYLGPLLSLAPAALVAAADGGVTVWGIVGLYAAIQFLESYLITPGMQRRIADLPPALTILAQGVMGLYSGILGVLLAAPLTAAGLVVVRMLYVEDVLKDVPPEPEVPPKNP